MIRVRSAVICTAPASAWKEHNISAPTEEETAEIEIEMKRIDDTIKANPLVVESRGYNKITTNFLRENDYFVPEPSVEVEEASEIEIPFASLELLWKTKQTVREKDKLDLIFINEQLKKKSKS